MKSRLERKIDDHMREVIRGASIAFPIRVVSAGIAFAINVLLARFLGVEDTGLYFLALTITTIATTVAKLGLGNVLVRLAASGAAHDDWGMVKNVAAKGTGIALLCAVGVSLMLGLSAPWLSENVLNKSELGEPLRWMALAVIPQTQMMLHAQLLRALKKIAISQFLKGISRPVLMLFGLVSIKGGFGATGAVWSYLLASWATALMAYWFWRRATREHHAVRNVFSSKMLLRKSFPLLQSHLMTTLTSSATTLMLGVMSTSAAVAIYGVALRTALLTQFIQLAINDIAAPKFAALHSSGDGEALATTARRSAFLMAIVASPMLLIFIAFPERIMGLFGAQFIEGASVLIILAIGQIVAIASGSVSHLLMMSGNERLLRNNDAMAAVVHILLNLRLIPELGATGAAISVCTAVIMRNLLGTVQVYRCFGILPFFIPMPADKSEKVKSSPQG